MKIGMSLHLEHGIDAVMEEARLADQQGYDSVWLFDHLMGFRGGEQRPDYPPDCLTLMAAIGAVTKRTRLAWGTLNTSFRNPALLAKTLATMDQITHGRVIATLGAGWFKDEYLAYNAPWVEDHDERIRQEREAILLLKELWTHPAPERTTFEGKFVTVRDLPFQPAPYQQPHPPIWIGGESPATMGLVKELGDGWMMLTAGGNLDNVARVLAEPDWPTRPMEMVKGGRIFVRAAHEDALADASAAYARAMAAKAPGVPASFEEFLARELVGSPDECLEQLDRLERGGITYLRLNVDGPEHQERIGALLLPRLAREAVAVAG
jgi:alkanesulfonate monooxygenase SsuD/methylene tetrahydromethanopterin reductase-like flavin-dependent oxidoreductase (luciferase family)